MADAAKQPGVGVRLRYVAGGAGHIGGEREPELVAEHAHKPLGRRHGQGDSRARHCVESQLEHSLTGSIPAEIGNLSNLERLGLPNNQLTGGIPAELGRLSNLRSLYIGPNQLTGEIP